MDLWLRSAESALYRRRGARGKDPGTPLPEYPLEFPDRVLQRPNPRQQSRRGLKHAREQVRAWCRMPGPRTTLHDVPCETAMRETIKRLLRPLLGRASEPARHKGRRYFGLNSLDVKLEKYLDFDNGYFVELGANDGVSQSNTLYFERYRNWHGVLIEPVLHNYFQCRANRSKLTQVFCNACTSFDYKDQFVAIAYSNLMSAPMSVESDIADPLGHARTGKTFLHSTHDNVIFGAVARTLNSILEEAKAPSLMDLLSLDVEGGEIAVLKGIDHARYRFRYICAESRDVERLAAFLQSCGYELVDQLSIHDYLFRCTATSPG
jgi:FkbM family methyltransferase